MINLFKKNIHSLFTTQNTTTTTTTTAISDLNLITGTTDVVDIAPKFLESAKSDPDPPPPPPATGRDWIDDTGGGGGGLVSCTESLGFESSDEIHNKNGGDCDGNGDDCDEIWQRRMMRAEGRGNRRKLRLFPPPLSSLNRNGKPSFFLRPVRKDGRLELTEVRIHRPEILHASRRDGRLTLHLIPDQVSLEEEEEEEEEEIEEELVEEEELEEEMVLDNDEKEEEGEVNDEIECEREERVTEWGFHEGLRRCHEMVNQHHNHHHNHVHRNHHQIHHHHMRMCGISIV